MSYMLCKAPNNREFYMSGKIMFSCFGYSPIVDKKDKMKVTGWNAIGYKEYSSWRDMANDMEECGIENIFTPFVRDFG